MKRKVKRIMVAIFAMAFCITSVPVKAAVNNKIIVQQKKDNNTTIAQDIYEGKGYRVTFLIVEQWEGGYNANVEIKNTGVATIENWILELSYGGKIINIWNAVISEQTVNGYIIKNVGWNQDIEPGKSMSFGISGQENFPGFPQEYRLKGGMECVGEGGYAVSYHVNSEWGSGFNGEIKNNADTVLEDWVLEFDFNRNITDIWNGVIESHKGNHYVIKNAGYNSNILVNESIVIGFLGNSGTSNDSPDNFSLYSFIIRDDKNNENNDEGVNIVINTEKLIKDDANDIYYVTDKSKNLAGLLTNSPNVKKMFYKVKDYRGNIVEKGDIKVEGVWEIPNVGYAIGANKIEITAVTKLDKKVKTNIIIFNDRTDNLSSNLDFNDSDGDNVPNFVEQYLGTDCNNTDTDKDGLSDYDEIYVLGSNPLLGDADEDMDEDGLSNIEEIKYQTDPFHADTDDDGLSDGDEINVYLTNPLEKDTDGDGVNDGKEIDLGTDPLVKEKSFDVVAGAKEKDKVRVSVEASLSGSQVESLAVNKFENDFLFPETMPGYIGGAYDFSVDGTFDSATIKFEFDKNLLADKSFKPVIYYFNEQEQELEPLNTKVTNNVAAAEVTHFSKYILINRSVYEESFEWQDVWSTAGYKDVEVVFVVDDSAILESLDKENERLEIAKNLIDRLPANSKIGIARINGLRDKLLTKTLTDDKEEAKAYLSDRYFHSGEASAIYNSVQSAFPLFETNGDNALRMMVVLSQGFTCDTSMHLPVVTMAKWRGIKIYTVGLGDDRGYFGDHLKPLAEETGGEFYQASDVDRLETFMGNINKKTDIETDSDNDGIPDFYEENMVMFNGVTITLDKNNPDSDGDGLLDGEEVAELKYEYNPDRSRVIVRGKLLSNPLKADSDGDGISDVDDPEPYKHFGTYLKNKIDFKLAENNEIKVPYNSAIESAKAVTLADYQKIYNERKPSWIVSLEDDIEYILGIRTRVAVLLTGACVVDGAFVLIGGLSGQKIDINAGCYFLMYYLSCIGGYEEYNGVFPAVEDENGKQNYYIYVNKLLDVCESGTKAGHSITFTQIDAACGDTPINYCATSLSALDYWLAVKGGNIGMTGACAYDGEYYNLTLYYCVEDYYDFYYDDPKGGKDSVGIVNNDEMAFLRLYGMAEPFENCGVYNVEIKWKKGQALKDAIQTCKSYSYLGH